MSDTTEESSLVGTARRLAARHHAGQVDKAGAPYIRHLERVAGRVSDLGVGHEAVAFLHDVLEDTDATEADLLAAGLGEHIVEAVVALTKVRGESNADYYVRVRTNTLAWNVKLADVDDNADPDRLAALDAPTRDRLTAKYHRARTALA